MNDCGECTACCTVFSIPEIGKEKHVKCSYCSNGCTIHDERPDTCRNYECLYIQSEWEEDLRPDKCGVILDKTKKGEYCALRITENIDLSIMDKIKEIESLKNIKFKGINAIK